MLPVVKTFSYTKETSRGLQVVTNTKRKRKRSPLARVREPEITLTEPISFNPVVSFPDPAEESFPSTKVSLQVVSELSNLVNATKTPNDYLRDWILKRRDFLHILLEREAPPSEGCHLCHKKGYWRCLECIGNALLCTKCCYLEHLRLPLHRIEKWNGRSFKPAWLSEIGTALNLGHEGKPCPSALRAGTQGGLGDPTYTVEEDSAGKDKEDNLKDTSPPDNRALPVLTIVDISGVHEVPVRYCCCSGHPKDEVQLLRYRLMPASYTNICTAFTTRLLDDFLLDNQECHTAAFDYFEKLRRVTSPAFPSKVKNRYSELLRLSRIWRDLKNWKWSGFGYSEKTPGDGDLALFCPACPQPGVNLAPGWEKEQDQNPLLYTRSFVLDGNFVANHFTQKRADDDVWLAAGTGVMTNREPYAKHLALVGEGKPKQKPDCNVTRALNAKVLGVGKDATGIGATACARHGFFCPTSCVDFQKGERQANIDYSASQGMKHSNVIGILRSILIYDANCIHAPNFLKRFEESPYLSIPPGLTIEKAIGTFHIHSHVKECYQRYGLLYMPGAGLIDGEILETLWSVLNHISPCTRGATAAHRDEIMDSHMKYSNWKKMTRIDITLLGKHKKACTVLEQAEKEFQKLSGPITEDKRQLWTSEAERVQKMRRADVKAMDWFAAKIVKDPTRIEVQLELSKNSDEPRTQNIVDVLSEGLHIQETQIKLRQFAQNFHSRATTKQELELRRKRRDLRTKIGHFENRLLALLGRSLEYGQDLWKDVLSEDVDKDVDEDEDEASSVISEEEFEEADHSGLDVVDSIEPEQEQICLPSTMGKERCDEHGIDDLRLVEIELRCGQANEALDNIRLELGKRAFLCGEARKAGAKRYRTRSRVEISTTTAVVNRWAQIYRKARAALVRLQAGDEIISKYQVLLKEHLHLSITLHDTSIAGHSRTSLPWFWALEHGESIEGSDVMSEYHRVHWLRAQAQRDRAKEEKTLVEHEMRWTINYFLHQAERWACLEKESELRKATRGHIAYARRQQDMWNGLADQTRDALMSIQGNP